MLQKKRVWVIKRIFKNDTIVILKGAEYNNYHSKPKTTITIDKGTYKLFYSVVFVDGIWGKVNVPYGSIGEVGPFIPYLDGKYKKGYKFYYLTEIKNVIYDLNITKTNFKPPKKLRVSE